METRYADKMSDKRTIAEKYGNKDTADKKTKINPKYKDIKKTIDSGNTIKSNQFMSDQLISKRKSEMFKRVKGSTIIKLLKISQESNGESIYNVGEGAQVTDSQPGNIKEDDKSVASEQTNKSNITGITAVTYATEMLGNLSDISFILLDLREPEEYKNIHIREAQSFPGVLISRDKFTQQIIMMKNQDSKMIILYHNDERNGIPFANNFFQKGYDNVYFLSGGIEDFSKKYPEYLEGLEREKYIKMKEDRDKQAKLIEDKKNGTKKSMYHLCGQIEANKAKETKKINELKKGLEKKK